MDVTLLARVFGSEQRWQGPCTVVVDAEAFIHSVGADAVVSSGSKVYAPRVACGRITAEHVCLMQDNSALVAVQQHRSRLATGEELVKQTVTVIDPASVKALEFLDTSPLTALGLPVPTVSRASGSHPGIALRPRT
jgi:hypothetical protein